MHGYNAPVDIRRAFRAVAGASLALFLSALLPPLAAYADRSPILVKNIRPGETVGYPLILLRGSVSSTGDGTIVIVNLSSDRRTRTMNGIVHGGRFKALAELVPGRNDLEIAFRGASVKLAIRYVFQDNPRFVRTVLVTDSTGSLPLSLTTAGEVVDCRERLGCAMLLLQCFTADEMQRLGYGRRTFNLELDREGRAMVRTLKLEAPASRYLAMNADDLYTTIEKALGREYPDDRTKNIALIGLTRYDAKNRKLLAHGGLGGGYLAMMGGSSISTWPSYPGEIMAAFMDGRLIDPGRFPDDSIGRQAYWANASTCIGVLLHELGHTWGLPHSSDWRDIMSRGHDYLNRHFTLVDAPSALDGAPREFTPDEEAMWTPPSAAALAPSRWLAGSNVRDETPSRTSVRIDEKTGELVAISGLGIAFVGFELPLKGMNLPDRGAYYRAPAPGRSPPVEIRIPAGDIALKVADADASVLVVDGLGNIDRISLKDCVRPYLRTWRFSPLTVTWTDTGSFPAVNPDLLASIIKYAHAFRVARSTSAMPFVDFLNHYPGDRREYVAGYAILDFRSPERRLVRIRAGSDDALRVWLNGKPVLQSLALRWATPDSDSATALVESGRNVLVAEVCQATGGWGLFMRFEDENGGNLAVDGSGLLAPRDRRLDELIAGAYARTWRFAPSATPWTDREAFPVMTDDRLKSITARARGAAPFVSPRARIDFLSRFPDGPIEDAAGYAVATVRSEKARKIRILTGSDDALRVWLNGRLVISKLELRIAKPDSESAEVELPAGESVILAEVCQGGGDWALYLRFTDDNGRPLVQDKDGRLAPFGF